MEAVLTITPRSPSSPGSSFAIAAAAKRIMLKVPTRLMFTAFANVSRRCGPSRPTTFSEGAMPAQFTRPCRWPKAWSARSTAALPSFSLVTSVRAKRAALAQFAGHGLARGAIHIGDDDKSAFGYQKPRRRRAQPRCAAGNKEDMILDLHGKLLVQVPCAAYHRGTYSSDPEGALIRSERHGCRASISPRGLSVIILRHSGIDPGGKRS